MALRMKTSIGCVSLCSRPRKAWVRSSQTLWSARSWFTSTSLLPCGHHERFGGPHAEVIALTRAGRAARGATLYVTLEPCCHFGKTPPCTDAILAAGITRVVAAMFDPFPEVNGGGLAALEAKGLFVETGCESARARLLNAPYLKRINHGHAFRHGQMGDDARWQDCGGLRG